MDRRLHRFGECVRALRDLAPQASVSITDDRVLSRFRLRRLARRAGLVVERELVVMPSIAAPVAVVEDTEWAVRAFWRTDTARTVQRALGARTLLGVLPIGVVRSLPWSWTGLLAQQRVVLGRRR